MSPTESVDLLIEPRWLLPIAPLNAALAGQALAVRGGRIVALGPALELRQRFRAREHLERPQHALLPGLVNAHTRSCHTLLTGLPVPPSRRRWLSETLAPLERRMNADFVRDGTRLGIAAMLRGGITCYADLSPLPDEAARTAANAQVRALIGLPVADRRGPWAEDANEYLARAERLWDEYRDDPRIGLYFAPLGALGLSETTLRRLRRVADELDAGITLHLDDLAASVGTSIGIADSAVAAELEQLRALGLLRPGFTALGACGLRRADAELLTRHGAALIGCPQAELRLGASPTVAALRLSERLALGTDSPAAAGTIDLFAEARIAALCAGLGAGEALRLVTLGAATVLGLGAEIGSLEVGKAADLTCIDLGTLAERAGLEVAAAIVFGLTRDAVSDVWSHGRALVSGHRLGLFDADELAALPGLWARRLALEAAA
jgi:5-methylthioadenosine/S-adenosylhomocysteine deaminase